MTDKEGQKSRADAGGGEPARDVGGELDEARPSGLKDEAGLHPVMKEHFPPERQPC